MLYLLILFFDLALVVIY